MIPPVTRRQIHDARRRNRRIESLAFRVQLYLLGIIGALAFAHITDSAARGVETCRHEQLAQCPEFLK